MNALDRLRKIEIEISSYCNRKCPWCTNTLFDRTNKINMKESLFIKIVSELERLDFKKTETSISFSKFNEPMYDLKLLKLRSYQLKLYLPDIKLCINTNGDFILENSDILKYPIYSISIMDYDSKGKEYGKNLLLKLGAKKIWINDLNQLETIINDVKVYFSFDWVANHPIEDRGNLLHKLPHVKWKNNNEIRREPCMIEKRPLSIDYLGNITPCCHIRNEANQHKPFVMGNIEADSIYNIINSEKFKKFNSIMEEGSYTDYFFPCQYCQK